VALVYVEKVTAGLAELPSGPVAVRTAASGFVEASEVGLGRPVAIQPRELVPFPILAKLDVDEATVVSAAPEAELEAPAALVVAAVVGPAVLLSEATEDAAAIELGVVPLIVDIAAAVVVGVSEPV